jgi:hypothetical protein
VHARHDVFAYVSLTIALCIVAMRRGDQLVHPSLALALGACGIATAYLLVRYRSRVDSATRLAPVLMLAGALVTAPPPTYRATETTLSDLFPGERLTFTGLLTPSGRSATLVRYAITCCRADATPIVIRLARRPAVASNAWLRADGTVRNDIDGFYLAASRIETIAPPADPFVYR